MDTLRRIVVIDDEPLSIRRMEIGLAGKPAVALVGAGGGRPPRAGPDPAGWSPTSSSSTSRCRT